MVSEFGDSNLAFCKYINFWNVTETSTSKIRSNSSFPQFAVIAVICLSSISVPRGPSVEDRKTSSYPQSLLTTSDLYILWSTDRETSFISAPVSSSVLSFSFHNWFPISLGYVCTSQDFRAQPSIPLRLRVATHPLGLPGHRWTLPPGAEGRYQQPQHRLINAAPTGEGDKRCITSSCPASPSDTEQPQSPHHQSPSGAINSLTLCPTIFRNVQINWPQSSIALQSP